MALALPVYIAGDPFRNGGLVPFHEAHGIHVLQYDHFDQ